MNVYELQERILELSHDEVTHDTNLRAKSLRWLNSAYHELVEILMPMLVDTISKDVTLLVVDGLVALTPKAQKILKIYRTDTQAEVPYKSADGVVPNSKQVTYRHTLDGIVLSGQKLPDELRIVYIPVVADLVEDNTEASVILPSQYHSALIWGALVWAAVFERGFSTQGELAMYQAKWDEAKRNAKLSLATRMSAGFKVQEFNLV